MSIKVTSNKEIRDTVLAGLKKNKDKYGKKYCPCSLVREDDTVVQYTQVSILKYNLLLEDLRNMK